METNEKSFNLSGVLKKVLYKNDETKYTIAVLENNQKIDLKNLLNFCHENNFSEVLIEAGSILTSAFLDQNLIDELWIYMAPCFLGSGARDMFNLPEILNLDQAQRWKIKSIQLIGPDLSVVLTRS